MRPFVGERPQSLPNIRVRPIRRETAPSPYHISIIKYFLWCNYCFIHPHEDIVPLYAKIEKQDDLFIMVSVLRLVFQTFYNPCRVAWLYTVNGLVGGIIFLTIISQHRRLDGKRMSTRRIVNSNIMSQFALFVRMITTYLRHVVCKWLKTLSGLIRWYLLRNIKLIIFTCRRQKSLIWIMTEACRLKWNNNGIHQHPSTWFAPLIPATYLRWLKVN